MVLAMISDQEKYKLNRSVVHRGAYGKDVMQHSAIVLYLQQVLGYFAREGKYDQFYIGITGDLTKRLEKHRRYKSDYTWMVPIYEEANIDVDNAFDRMESEAIDFFRTGFTDPVSGRRLKCGNEVKGASPKMHLYILIREKPKR